MSHADESADDRERLMNAMEQQMRVLAGLRDALAVQRAAVAEADPGALDAATQDVARLSLILDEAARVHRATDPASMAGTLADPEVRGLRDRLREVGRLAAGELALTQYVLKRAVQAGERELHALLSLGPAPGYEATGATHAATAPSGVLLNARA